MYELRKVQTFVAWFNFEYLYNRVSDSYGFFTIGFRNLKPQYMDSSKLEMSYP